MENLKKKHNFWSYFLLYPVALLLIFEEWGWEPLSHLFDRLTNLNSWKHIEDRVAHLSPIIAFIILLFPMLALIPIKLFGVFLFDNGHFISGVTIVIVAKLFGTAFVSRLFHLTLPALMKMNWFAKWYPRWKEWKDKLLDEIRSSTIWHWASAMNAKIKRRALELIKR